MGKRECWRLWGGQQKNIYGGVEWGTVMSDSLVMKRQKKGEDLLRGEEGRRGCRREEGSDGKSDVT